MEVEELGVRHKEVVVALWRQAGLTRPWNSPNDDFDRATTGNSSAVLGAFVDDVLVATVMVGHDGHRGWVYYLAVDNSKLNTGLGATMMSAAEEWVRRSGVPKIQLMVRSDNSEVRNFYLHRGYVESDVTVYGLRFDA